MSKAFGTVGGEAVELEKILNNHQKQEVELLEKHIKAADRVAEGLQSHYFSLTGQRYIW